MSDLKDLLDEAVERYRPRSAEEGVRRRVERRELRRRLTAALVGLVVFVAAGWFAWAGLRPSTDSTVGVGPDEEPIYWVDGARPKMDSKVHTEDEIAELCPQYSADRPDIHICEDVPEGWTPPPLPYYDEAICRAALNWMAENRLFKSIEVDTGSCRVAESNNANPVWDVVFVRSSGGGDNVHVPFDPTGETPWAAHP